MYSIGRQTTDLPALEDPKIHLLGYDGENGCLQFLLVVYSLENYSKYSDDFLALR